MKPEDKAVWEKVVEILEDNREYIEANERPGLANHEPQPTAERFMDFLFPQTAQAPDETTLD
jgi:hypothetical protein